MAVKETCKLCIVLGAALIGAFQSSAVAVEFPKGA